MDIKTLVTKNQPIKNKSHVNVLAISSDDQVQLTRLIPVRQFLVTSKDENQNDSAWGIDTLKPLIRADGTRVMCQVILEDSCVPQRTTYEDPYKNDNIMTIMKDIYHKTKYDLEKEKQKQLALRYLQIGIAAVLGIFLIGMIFA